MAAVVVVSRHEAVDPERISNPRAATLKDSRQKIPADEARLRGAEVVLSTPGFARAERMGERIAELVRNELAERGRGVHFTGISSGMPRTEETVQHHLNGFRAHMLSNGIKLIGPGHMPGYELLAAPSLALIAPKEIPHYPTETEAPKVEGIGIAVARGERLPEWDALIPENR